MNLHTLQTAREKLQATDVPLQLRAVYYIRLSCLALNSDTLTYSSLMQSLANQQVDWWQTCMVSQTGDLQSTVLAIAALLEPINRLHHLKALQMPVLPLVA